MSADVIVRLLSTCALLLTLLFAVVMGLSRLQPDNNPAVMVLGSCNTSCWEGIQPGITSGDAALVRLNDSLNLTRSESQCFLSDSCTTYQWIFTANRALYAMIEVDHGQVVSVDAFIPGFNLGQGLLALKDFPMNGGDLNKAVADQFHIGLHVAGSQLILKADTSCPDSYRGMLSAPVNIIEVQTPAADQPLPGPTLDFPTFRRAFNRICGGG